MASVAKRRWKKPDGSTGEKWVVRYLDRGGRHRQRTFERKKDADTYEREVENELSAGTHVARRDSRTIAQLADEFSADIERRRGDGKVGQGYLDLARLSFRHVLPSIGNILVRDLTWRDVERLSIDLRSIQTRYRRALSPRSQRNILTLLGTVIGYATRRGYCARNVVPDAMREIGPMRPPKIETFSRDEIKRLFATMEARAPCTQERPQLQMKAMVCLATVCALRRGEILGLTADHIDFARGVVMIRQALDGKTDQIKGPKTASGVRTVPMPGPVADVVRAYMRIAHADERGLLFRGRHGQPLYGASFTKVWHALLLRAGFPPIQSSKWRHFHALRHFGGSAWLHGGVPLAEVSKLMGHAHVGITASIYAHAIVGTLERSAELALIAQNLLPPPLPVAHELRMAS